MKPLLEVKRSVEQLSAAGVLDVSRDNKISVHPLRLRQALVRDVFLKPPLVDLTSYLLKVPDDAAATRVLIEAKLMGGILPDEILRERLKHLEDDHEQLAFEEYAYLGRSEAEWVLDNFPNKFKSVAPVALNVSPEKTLNLLLDAAAQTYAERSSQGWSIRIEDLLPEIKRWILSANPNSDESSKRRKLLSDALETWFAAKKNPYVAVPAVALILSLKHEITSTPIGEPMTLTIHFGIVSQSQLHLIAALWSSCLRILREAKPSQQSAVANIFHEWIHPDFHGKNTPKEYEEESHGLASHMMTELLATFEGNWTMHHHLHYYAEKLGLLAEVKINPIVRILYPPRDFLDWEADQKSCQSAADTLATQLNKMDPTEVAGVLTNIEEQARAAAISHPSWGRYVCCKIAEDTDNLVLWIQALFECGAPAHLLEPFLEKKAKQDASIAEIDALLASQRIDSQALGVELILKHFSPVNPIWQKASVLFKKYTGLIEGCVLRKEINNENLKALLLHEEPKVSGTTAANLWGIRDETTIPAELFEDWRKVIIKYVDEGEEHILEKIFPHHPDIAFEWISWRVVGIRTETRHFYFGLKYDRLLPIAVSVLTANQRRKLIDELPRSSAVSALIRCLVGADVEMFRYLLSREELEESRLDPLRIDNDGSPHLQPLIQEFDEAWQKMAIAAMESGFSAADIFWITQSGSFTWSGPRSAMLATKLAPFEKLLQHPDNLLRNVGQIGFAHFSKLHHEQLAAEKRADVRGVRV